MAVLTVQEITRAGVSGALTAAAGGGDSFANDGRTYFDINNGGGSPITATFVTQQTVDGLAVADLAVSVANGTRVKIGPFPPGIYNDGNGRVQVNYSGVTTVTVNPFRVP